MKTNMMLRISTSLIGNKASDFFNFAERHYAATLWSAEHVYLHGDWRVIKERGYDHSKLARLIRMELAQR